MSCQVALGGDATYAISRRALARPAAFLAAGAPMHVVRAMLRCTLESDTRSASSSPVPLSWLDAAVRGDRPDVLAHMHSMASVDHAHDITAESWTTVGRARWRRLYGEARGLLMEASSGGRLHSLVWLLGFYAAPRFAAPRPLYNQALMSALCAGAAATGRDAAKMLAALHDHMPRRLCSCHMSMAFTCLLLDRPDLVDWMEANGCAASTNIMMAGHRRSLLDSLISRRAARSLAWVAARSSQRSVIERMLDNPRQHNTREWRAEMALLIMGMGATKTLLGMVAESALSFVGQLPRRRLTAASTCCAGKVGHARPALAHNSRLTSAIAVAFIAFLVVAVVFYCHIIVPA